MKVTIASTHSNVQFGTATGATSRHVECARKRLVILLTRSQRVHCTSRHCAVLTREGFLWRLCVQGSVKRIAAWNQDAKWNTGAGGF